MEIEHSQFNGGSHRPYNDTSTGFAEHTLCSSFHTINCSVFAEGSFQSSMGQSLISSLVGVEMKLGAKVPHGLPKAVSVTRLHR